MIEVYSYSVNSFILGPISFLLRNFLFLDDTMILGLLHLSAPMLFLTSALLSLLSVKFDRVNCENLFTGVVSDVECLILAYYFVGGR